MMESEKTGVIYLRYDKQMLADYNKGRVLEEILKRGPINRAEIAKQLGLSIPTIMKIVDEFQREGILRTVGKAESTGGKRPELYEIIKGAYYCIGVDLGRFKLKIVLTNMMGEILVKKHEDISHIDEPAEVISIIEKHIEELIENQQIPNSKVMGIGLGVPGIIEKESGTILYSPDFGWEKVDLVTDLKKKFGFWVEIENSNRTGALAEKWMGVAQSSNNLFSINIGHGIGAAILKEEDIYQGSSGASGEFGHLILDKDGPLCDCGNRGCLEAISSGNAIAKRMGMKEAKEVFDLARAGNEQAIRVIDEAVEYLGIGIASVINILDPDMVVLSGGVMQSSDLFWDKLCQEVKKRQIKYGGRKVKIKAGILGEDATALGAAVLLIKNFKNHGGQIV